MGTRIANAARGITQAWVGFGPRFLPFADAASPDLPLPRLLRLSLFQVSVGMALVLLIGTLNRVMIVELGMPASLVAIMISLPIIFAPLRIVIGFRSDTYRSPLGWRRVPFIWHGTLVQFGGLAIMPFALLVLSRGGEAANSPEWIGYMGAAVAFLLVGAGLHTVQTVGLALASDLAPPATQPKVVGLMYVMLLLGMILSAVLFGIALADFSPLRLIQVIQAAAVATMALNLVALWKQETRRPTRGAQTQPPPSFEVSWAAFSRSGHALRRLAVIGMGTMAFSLEDVLLEPYGGQILHLSVAVTTALAAGGLAGFALASRTLKLGVDPMRLARHGAMTGIPAFLAVILSAQTHSLTLFAAGTFFIGLGAGLFGHGTLTATMQLAPDDKNGMALGAWGAVQASAAGLSIALGGILRDCVGALAERNAFGSLLSGPAAGYIFVYGLEIVLLVTTLAVMTPLLRPTPAPMTRAAGTSPG
jgi:MFS transporter, BCD family, chlorophyll transporter